MGSLWLWELLMDWLVKVKQDNTGNWCRKGREVGPCFGIVMTMKRQ